MITIKNRFDDFGKAQFYFFVVNMSRTLIYSNSATCAQSTMINFKHRKKDKFTSGLFLSGKVILEFYTSRESNS